MRAIEGCTPEMISGKLAETAELRKEIKFIQFAARKGSAAQSISLLRIKDLDLSIHQIWWNPEI